MRADVLNKNSGAYDGKTRPTTIFKWNYISCGSPMFSHGQLTASSGPVVASGHRFGMVFPGENGELYPADLAMVGVTTGAIETPQMEGTVPAIDTATTAAGLNMQMDAETADNTGVEICN